MITIPIDIVIFANMMAIYVVVLASLVTIPHRLYPASFRRFLRIRMLRIPLLLLQACLWAISMLVCIPLFIHAVIERALMDPRTTESTAMYGEYLHLTGALLFGLAGYFSGCYLMYLCSEARRGFPARRPVLQEDL